VDVVQQLDVVAARVADVLEHLQCALDVGPDLHVRINRRSETGLFEIGLLRQVGRAVAAALDADVPEPSLHRPPDALFDLRERAPAAMCVAIDREPALAAHQLVDGHVRPLALDVPQGLVEPAQRVVEHRAVPPVRAGIGVLPHILDVLGVAPLRKRPEVFVDRRHHRQRSLVERRAAEPVQARLARFDLHHAQTDSLRSGEDRSDVGDLQRGQSLCRLGVLCGRGILPAARQSKQSGRAESKGPQHLASVHPYLLVLIRSVLPTDRVTGLPSSAVLLVLVNLLRSVHRDTHPLAHLLVVQ